MIVWAVLRECGEGLDGATARSSGLLLAGSRGRRGLLLDMMSIERRVKRHLRDHLGTKLQL